MPIVLKKQDLISLLRDKKPEKYKALKAKKQLNQWAEQELKNLYDNYDQIMKDNPQMNAIEAREWAMEEYL